MFNGSESLKAETFSTSQGDIALKIKEFLGKYGPGGSILVIPRSEVLQKEMTLRREGGRDDLESQLAELLPYSVKEMAYSLAVSSAEGAESSRGLLYAIPEEKIKKILDRLEGFGIFVEEAVSEDQALFWLFQDKAIAGPILVFDQDPDRLLVLALKESAILLSRTYPPDEPLKNVLSEISFSLLEAEVKPSKAFILEGMSEADEVSKVLEIPAEIFSVEILEKKPILPALSGVKKRGGRPAISLLPNGRKLQKKTQQQNKLLKESLAAFGSFLVCFSLLAASHLFILKTKKSVLENESKRIALAVAEVRQMSGSLEAVHEAERSKQRLLSFLGELARRVPSSIRLKELQVEGKSIVFQGESPSHSLLTETVQALEKIEGLKEAKLEHARLRKRLNQDFFDFEVTAQWQN